MIVREDKACEGGRYARARLQESDDTGAAGCEGLWLDRWKTYGWLSGRVVEWSRERRNGEACFLLSEKVLFV